MSDSTNTPTGQRLYVAGHRGLVGGAIARLATEQGYEVIGRTHSELELRDEAAVRAFFEEVRPDQVVLAAAQVGGIVANSTYPIRFLEDNLRIQLNVISAAYEFGVQKLLFLGSSCIYPKLAEQPIKESSLLTGPLEPTNDAYAIAKIAGIRQVVAYRQEHGVPYISAMPTNVYGPGDNFDLVTSHVLPALIRRFHEAKMADAPVLTLWGTGTPLREFIHSADLASACLTILQNYDDPETINVGVGADLSIRQLAETVRDIIGYTGTIEFDPSKPDGTPRKLLDSDKLRALGWTPSVSLSDGIRSTYDWWLEHRSERQTAHH